MAAGGGNRERIKSSYQRYDKIMQVEQLLRNRDNDSVRELLQLHVHSVNSRCEDWVSSNCMRITIVAVSVAKRIAENLAIALRDLKDSRCLNGYEDQFNIDTREISGARLLTMALYAAELLAGEFLVQSVRDRPGVKIYLREVANKDPQQIFIFRSLLNPWDVPQYGMSHYSKKVKAACCGFF